MILSEYKNKLSSAKGQRAYIGRQIIEKEDSIDSYVDKLHSLEEAQVFLQKVAQATQEQLRVHIKDIVQLCLDSVWPGEIQFDLIYEVKRGKTEARLVFIIDGEEVDPLEGEGGGMVHMAAFALRVAVWTLGTTRNTIILDEPLAALQPLELQLLGFKIIRELSDKLGLQFIIVKNSVNSGDLENIADKVFQVERKRINNYWQSVVKTK